MWWPFIKRDIENTAHKAVKDFSSSHEFKSMLDGVILDAIRELPNDKELSYVGFINKMAITLFDAAKGVMSYEAAKRMAVVTWQEFAATEGITYGNLDYGWTGSDAVTLARECCIDYWV